MTERRRHTWTAEDDVYLTRWYSQRRIEKLAGIFGVTILAVYKRAHNIGLTGDRVALTWRRYTDWRPRMLEILDDAEALLYSGSEVKIRSKGCWEDNSQIMAVFYRDSSRNEVHNGFSSIQAN